MGDSALASLVARLKDDTSEQTLEQAVELSHPSDFSDSEGTNSLPSPGLSLGPISSHASDDIDDGEERDDQQPLLRAERGERPRGGDVELKIPLRLQRMRAVGGKKEKVIHKPYFTILISVVDVILIIVELIVNKGFESLKVNPWLGVSGDTLLLLGGKYTPMIIGAHQWWRLITPVFLHVGLAHLVLNLIGQLLLGIQLERVLGTPRIIILYFVSAVAGNLCSAIFLPLQLEVGASTAIYGMASYYLVDLLIHWTLIFAPFRYFLALVLGSVLGLALGLLPGLDNFAHLGGSAGGFLVSLLLVPRTKEGRSLKYAKIATWVGPPALLVYFTGGIVILCVAVLREDIWRCGWCEYMNCLPVAHWCDSG